MGVGGGVFEVDLVFFFFFLFLYISFCVVGDLKSRKMCKLDFIWQLMLSNLILFIRVRSKFDLIGE